MRDLKMVRRPHFFYGWIIVGITALSMMLIYGIRHTFSVFFPSILDEFGWSRGSTAFMLSLNILIYGFLAPIAGSLGDRWKPHWIMLSGITFLGLATAGCAFAQELWHFYLLIGILMPLGTTCCGWPLLAPTLANWFVKKRATAIGIAQIGVGLSFAYGMFTEFAISELGWRHTYFALAGILVVLLWPAHLFFFRYRPESMGWKAYGASTTPEAAPAEKSTSQDWTLKQAMRTYQLWLLTLSMFLFWGIGAYLVTTHQVKFAEDMGYSRTFAASIFALYGISLIAGAISAGISDWIGRELTVTLSVILAVAALVALVSVQDTSQPWLLYLYAICFGYGIGLYTPSLTAGAADIFHGKHFGAIAGLLLVGLGIGGAIGPWLGGYIHDTTGSYFSAFILAMACFVLAGIAVWIAAPRKAARLRDRAERMPI